MLEPGAARALAERKPLVREREPEPAAAVRVAEGRFPAPPGRVVKTLPRVREPPEVRGATVPPLRGATVPRVRESTVVIPWKLLRVVPDRTALLRGAEEPTREADALAVRAPLDRDVEPPGRDRVYERPVEVRFELPRVEVDRPV